MTQRARDRQQHLMNLRSIAAQNLRMLEEQAALYGPMDTPLRLVNEIEREQEKIAEYDRVLNPGRPVSRETLAEFDEVDRMIYVIGMHMKIDSDFRQLRHDIRHFTRGMLALVACSTLGLVAQRLSVSWHAYVLIGVLILILAGVALDMYLTERRER